MELKEIANKLVSKFRNGQSIETLSELYDTDAISVEAIDHGNGREAMGIEAIREKHQWWDANVEVKEESVSDAMLHGDNKFAVIFKVYGRFLESGEEFHMEEIAVYYINSGKIVREEFFLSP